MLVLVILVVDDVEVLVSGVGVVCVTELVDVEVVVVDVVVVDVVVVEVVVVDVVVVDVVVVGIHSSLTTHLGCTAHWKPSSVPGLSINCPSGQFSFLGMPSSHESHLVAQSSFGIS